MPIPFRCQQCGATGTAGSRFAGQLIHCPKCQALVKIPATKAMADEAALAALAEAPPARPVPRAVETSAIVTTPPPPPAGPPVVATLVPEPMAARTAVQPTAADRSQQIWLPATLLCGLAWLLTLRAAAPLAIAIHYAAMMAMAVYWVRFTASAWPAKLSLTVGLAAAVVLAIAWWQHDYYRHEWHRDDGAGRWTYTDWYHRGAEHPFYRKAFAYFKRDDEDDNYSLRFVNITGTFSESGKMHGHWHRSASYGSFVKGRDEEEDSWYWYDELISEGEWHLRNR